MKKFYLVLCLMFGFAISAFAQDRVLSGVVTDDTGESLPGVNVVVKGTTIGTITDLDGKYTIKVPEGATELVYSFIGFTSITKLIGVEKVMDITMGEDLIGLEEVVVTALGVSKSEKSLGYSVQKVEGSDMTAAREANIVNSLNGKVAGIQINNSSGAVGASTRITLRGASSIKGNNQPLFIVDGIPIDNGNYGTATSSGGFDAPNGIADINPDDIESLSVLKGPTAAALYGVRAANGVIVITTKKGTKGKGLGISFNSSTTFETPLVIPDFQNSYGQGGNADFFEWVDGSSSDGGVDESWGPPLDTGLEYVQWDSEDGQPKPWVSQPDNIKNFYDTGRTLNNNLSFTGGNEVATYRLSLGNMNQKGIVPNTDYQRYTVGGASSLRIADKVDVTFNLNYIKGQADNLPTGGYDNENPVQQMIWSGRNVNFEDLKDYENLPLSPEGTAAEGTPLNWNTVFQNNPYWVLDNNLNGIDKDRIIGGVQVKYQITDFLGVSLKSGTDFWNSVTTERKAKGSNEFSEGYYRERSRKFSENNTEALLMFNKGLSDDIDFSFNVGANRMDRKYTRLSGEAGQLELPGVYSLANIRSGVSPVLTSFLEKSRINSIYGFGQIGFRNAVYLDFSGRNDWASVLPADNNSFFYPAVNLSVIASDLFNITSNTLSFLKIRGGWSKVGGIGALDPYKLVQTYSFRDDPWGSTLLPYNPETLNNPNLIAETTTGIEIGVDARLFRGRVTVDATYYNQTSADLILDAEISAASGYEFAFQNVGEMQNSGVELQLGLSAIKRKNLTVDVGVNFAKNTNLVKSLGDLDALILGGQWNVDIQAREGEPYGTIFGPGYLRNDEGSIVHANGLPQIDTENKILGNVTPDWTGGVTLDINFRGITVGAVVDAKIGGDIYSMTTTWGRYAGVLDETLKGRETGIVGEGVKVVTPAVVDPDTGDEITPAVYAPNDIVVGAESYNKAAYSNSVAEGSVFDASFVKLRQIVIGYDLPSKLFKGKVFKKASIALVGRNLAILYKKVPHIDPESAFSSSNGDQGLEFGQIPSVRSIGFNLNFDF